MAADRNPRLLKALFSGSCYFCKGKIEKGQECWHIKEHRRVRGEWMSAIYHLDGECVSPYQVHVIYSSTRKVITVNAASAEEALDIGRRRALRGKKVSLHVDGKAAVPPHAFEVWQGDMRVLR